MPTEYPKEEIDNATTSGGFARWDRPLAKGTYEADIDDAMDWDGKSGPCSKFVFVIDAPVEAAPEGPVKIDHYVATRGSVKEFLQVMDPVKLTVDPVCMDPPLYKGRRCRVVIGEEEFNGEMKPKVQRILPLEAKPGAGRPSATASAPATGSNADRPRRSRRAAPAAPPQSQAQTDQGADDDSELPF